MNVPHFCPMSYRNTCRLCKIFEQISLCLIEFADESVQLASPLLQCQDALKIESHFQISDFVRRCFKDPCRINSTLVNY